MKKRILALALAGTTAFSVFGGLNVFAKTPDEAYDGRGVNTISVETGKGIVVTINGTETVLKSSDVKYAPYKTVADALVFDSGTDVAIEKDKIYLMDYKALSDENEEVYFNLSSLIEDIQDSKKVEDVAKVYGTGNYENVASLYADLSTLLKDYYGTGAKPETGYNAGTSSLHRSVYADYEELVDNVVDADDYENATDYHFDDLVKDITTNVKVDTATTSDMLYLMQQYDTILNLLDPVDTASTEDWIDIYTSVLDARSEADYKKASSYSSFYTEYLKLQEKYEDATSASKLNEYAGKLYDLIVENTGTSAGVDKAALADAVDVAGEYTKKDFGKSDNWEYFQDVLAEAKEINGKFKSYSYQSTVDAYTDLLNEAIALLDPNSSSKDWAVLRLESAVEDAKALVETDYTTSSWKSFAATLERAETLLAADNTSTAMLTKVAEQLEKAKLTPKAVPSSLKRELKDTLKDAKDMMEEMTDSASGNQLLGLSTAINDADDLWKTKYTTLKDDTLISEVEAATAALEEAMTLAQHPQGWYQDENGTWFYGVGTENYTGWLELNGRTYFLKDDGSMAASTWVKTEKGYWYYLNASGAMMHDGWAKINDTWYFFKNFGGMAEGWVKDGNTWYYLTPGSGAMVSNGWSLINGKYYYFDASGAMLANTTTPDGYKVDASGAWVK